MIWVISEEEPRIEASEVVDGSQRDELTIKTWIHFAQDQAGAPALSAELPWRVSLWTSDGRSLEPLGDSAGYHETSVDITSGFTTPQSGASLCKIEVSHPTLGSWTRDL